jgi:hypothetical protein
VGALAVAHPTTAARANPGDPEVDRATADLDRAISDAGLPAHLATSLRERAARLATGTPDRADVPYLIGAAMGGDARFEPIREPLGELLITLFASKETRAALRTELAELASAYPESPLGALLAPPATAALATAAVRPAAARLLDALADSPTESVKRATFVAIGAAMEDRLGAADVRVFVVRRWARRSDLFEPWISEHLRRLRRLLEENDATIAPEVVAALGAMLHQPIETREGWIKWIGDHADNPGGLVDGYWEARFAEADKARRNAEDALVASAAEVARLNAQLDALKTEVPDRAALEALEKKLAAAEERIKALNASLDALKPKLAVLVIRELKRTDDLAAIEAALDEYAGIGEVQVAGIRELARFASAQEALVGRAIDRLTRALSAADPAIRAAAVDSLRPYAASRVLPLLEDRFTLDADELVQVAVVRAFRQMALREPIVLSAASKTRILALVSGDNGSAQRTEAIRCAGAMKWEDAVPLLLRDLRSAPVAAQRAMVESLGRIRSAASAAPLIEHLRWTASPEIAWVVVHEFADWVPAATLPALVDLAAA